MVCIKTKCRLGVTRCLQLKPKRQKVPTKPPVHSKTSIAHWEAGLYPLQIEKVNINIIIIIIIIIINYFKLYNITTLVAKSRIDSFGLTGTGSICHMFLLTVEFSNTCRFRVFHVTFRLSRVSILAFSVTQC